MEKRQKDLLRALVAQLRLALLGTWDEAGNQVRGDLDRELERLGVAPDGTLSPLDALSNVTTAERRARRIVEAQLAGLPAKARPAARREIVERAGYTWINRLLALRAMEARGLIDETLRANLAYDGLSEALYILRQTQPARTSVADGGWWAVVEDACRAQAEALPGLFDLDDPNAALRPSTPALLNCVALVGGGLAGFTPEESDAAFADPDAIGWAYQFYQEEAKARTYAKLGSGGKVETRSELASVTQLFTEPYMVKWLLQNSLGRTYHELYPDSRLPKTWQYYILLDRAAGQRPTDEPGPASLEELTLMDPAMGSGHFLRESFDMLADMYWEQHPDMSAREIADTVLSRHLHGIDIDPRAAQLAALSLYMRAWELVHDERRAQRLPGVGSYQPATLNLATTPTGLTPGALERHLERHPEDRVYDPLLRAVFAALEQAPILGSLLHPGDQVDAAIRAFWTQSSGQLSLLVEDANLNRLLGELARHDPGELTRVLLDRVGHSFAAEAGNADDAAMSLFGREASEGVKLLQLLDRQYYVVVTNPPYMSTRNMPAVLQLYTEQHYRVGKRDVFAAFMLRCMQFCQDTGRLAMITMQSWMFLQSFAELRVAGIASETGTNKPQKSGGLLVDTSFEVIAHLGANAFEEIGGEIVQSVMFCVQIRRPCASTSLVAMRLVDLESSREKAEALVRQDTYRKFVVPQESFLNLPDGQLAYWIRPKYLELLRLARQQNNIVEVKAGVVTGENTRFVRGVWEIAKEFDEWRVYAKGGGYQRWYGLENWCLRWPGVQTAIAQNRTGRIRDETFFGRPGWNYSGMANGNLAVRYIGPTAVYDNGSPVVFPKDDVFWEVGAILQTRIASYLLRLLSQSIRFNAYYVGRLPYPEGIHLSDLENTARSCLAYKQYLVALDPTEYSFNYLTLDAPGSLGTALSELNALTALLHTCEGFLESRTHVLYGLGSADLAQLMGEMGTPPAFHPIVEGYGAIPDLPQRFGCPAPPPAVLADFALHKRLHPSIDELTGLKTALHTFYETALTGQDPVDDLEKSEEIQESVQGSRVGSNPQPSEDLLEQLSSKLQIHPISIYWLLEELRNEGVRCKPEEQRLLEDRLSVLVLRLLGHHWPKQIEAGKPVPKWADPDGIIPLTSGTGETPLADRLRARLRAEDGPLSAQQVEALLQELTGQDLETWLRKSFFPRHVRQFKRRPIAWHLASTPRGRKKGGRTPAFECLLYYHTCGGDVLARLRSHYLETLLYAERRQVAHVRQAGDETAAARSTERIHELDDFAARLRQVEAEGFACPELEEYVQNEPLDRWSGDGVFAPASRGELLADEQAWHVDINDGVRVNIAPLQQAGLLAANVLSAKDLRKAIADRARWRSDERRWVREGVLPRCGWMDESVPESPRWAERAPEREAERQRLEEKRQALTERLEGMEETAG